jgi:hypothetical protein
LKQGKSIKGKIKNKLAEKENQENKKGKTVASE